MRVVFSSLFKEDLTEAESRYASISPRLGDDLHARVKEAIRTIIRWKGGDHVGPHGYPSRKCRPFPYIVYYEIDGDTLHVLGLVHERRHPNYLHRKLGES